ncbi:unnamed protein product [Rotaria sordida]|uniref:Divalent-cation tolerance protein CutA n=1 Tax=Rotaria sordida TaxID=392033 RepID=A0A819D5Y8_9BILA|nr:unnamed protein product [Rotaria sordida]
MSSNKSFEYSACVTTVSTDEVARKLARSLIEAHLATCVNIIPSVRSIYEWQSKIHEDNELILMIKIRKEYNQSYDVPELIELPITSGNPDYFKWIDGIVKQQSST